MACECKKVDESDFCKDVAHPGWDDPILGTAYSTFPADQKMGPCVFIACLSAVGWVWPLVTEPFKCRNASGTDAHGIRTYTIPFRFPQATYPVEEKVALNAGSYCYSHSKNLKELWVALYEKAYVKKLTGGNKCDSYLNTPFPVTPMDPLKHITGYNGNSELVSANIYGKITDKCYKNKTKYATVVWSLNHAYTVLGYMVSGGTEYLVLRDPTNANAFIRNDIIENTNWEIEDHFYWNPATGRQGGRGALVVTLSNGIFALKHDKVKDYFQGAAWSGPV